MLSPAPSPSERPGASAGPYGEETRHLGLERLVHSIWGAQRSRDISVNTGPSENRSARSHRRCTAPSVCGTRSSSPRPHPAVPGWEGPAPGAQVGVWGPGVGGTRRQRWLSRGSDTRRLRCDGHRAGATTPRLSYSGPGDSWPAGLPQGQPHAPSPRRDSGLRPAAEGSSPDRRRTSLGPFGVRTPRPPAPQSVGPLPAT